MIIFGTGTRTISDYLTDYRPMGENELNALLGDVRACDICVPELPLGPRPVLRVTNTARFVIIGQAPGTRVHESGIPWNDRSGDRLRDWLELDHETFYDEDRVAIMPMGFCYPGVNKSGGDKPPRKECAREWHGALWPFLGSVELVLLVGSYAQKYYLGRDAKKTLTETVAKWQEYSPKFIPMPHPSWRNTAWLKRNPWFESDLLPPLRRRIRKLVSLRQ